MLSDFYINWLSNDMKIAVQKYLSLLKKRRQAPFAVTASTSHLVRGPPAMPNNEAPINMNGLY